MLVLSLLTAFLAVEAPAVSPQSTETATPRATPPSAPPSDTEVSDEIVVVETRGAGATPREAFDDAVREALRQVVGTFIRSDSRLQNDQLVQDRVISHSQGFIEKVEKIGIAELKDGVYLQEARVHVRRGRISAAMVAPGPQSVEVDGSTLAARVTTMIEQKRSAQELIEALFEGWPASVMNSEVSQGPLESIRGVKRRPEPASSVVLPPSHTYVEVKVDVWVNQDKWMEWIKAARQVFRAVALKEREFKWNLKSSPLVSATKTGEGLCFVGGFRDYMSSQMARASHLNVRSKDAELERELKSLLTEVTPDDGSLKGGVSSQLSGTPVALYGELGSNSVTIYVLPIEEHGQDAMLREAGLQTAIYPSFAPVPRISCELVTQDELTVGSVAREPAKDHLAIVGNYTSPGYSGQFGENFSMIGSPLVGFDTPHKLNPRAYAFVPGFHAIQRNGSSERVFAPRMTFVFGYVVPDDELEQIKTVRIEVTSERGDSR